MSEEHVCNCNRSFIGVLTPYEFEVGERIIRCRDCKNFEDVMGAFECEQSSGEPHHAEPDGFCSWAELREEE